LQVLQKLPSNDDIRTKSLFFIHRMIEFLAKDILPFLPSIVTVLIQTRNMKDLIEFIRLFNQLVGRFKVELFPLADKLLVTIISAVFDLLNATKAVTPNSEEERERNDLKKHYFSFLVVLVSNDLHSVLTSQSNMGQLNFILQSVIDGCAIDGSVDMAIQKHCFVFMDKIIRVWGGSQGFDQFIFQQVLPTTFSLSFHPKLDLKDGATYHVVLQITKLYRLILEKYGEQFIAFINNYLASTWNCPPTMIQHYLQNIKTLGQNDFNAYYLNFISQYHRLRPS